MRSLHAVTDSEFAAYLAGHEDKVWRSLWTVSGHEELRALRDELQDRLTTHEPVVDILRWLDEQRSEKDE